MNMMTNTIDTDRYQNCIDASKRVRWEIEGDVIRGRRFGSDMKFLPDGLSFVPEMETLGQEERIFISQIQGRTYANMFGMVERFVNAKILELTNDHIFANQTALEALVRFSDEEMKHQALFRRVDGLCAEAMPAGYAFNWDCNDVANAVLAKSTWAVLALTLHIELFSQAHYRQSIDKDDTVSGLYRDVFKFHWMEESQHALIDELELRRIDATITDDQRDDGVVEFIDLVGAVDSILQGQAIADAAYFAKATDRIVSPEEETYIAGAILKAYRWQYILSGAQHSRFQKVLGDLLAPAQIMKVEEAVGMLV
jgi:hypothetical protein